MRLLTLAAALAVAAAAPAADPKPAPPPAIRATDKVAVTPAPAPQPAPSPAPAPAPQPAPFVFNPDRVFAVESDLDLSVITTSPPGRLAAVKRPSGAIMVLPFADGDGSFEERTFAGKSVYTLTPTPLARAERAEAVAKGLPAPRFELIVVPAAVAGEADLYRKEMVLAGPVAPVPPAPTPGPKPTPDPVPDVKPAPKGDREFWAVVLEETGERSVAAAKVLNAADFWRGLSARGHNYRFIDKDNPFAKAGKYLEAAQAKGVALPAVLLFDRNAPAGQPADPVAVFALPATTAEVDAQIKKEGGK